MHRFSRDQVALRVGSLLNLNRHMNSVRRLAFIITLSVGTTEGFAQSVATNSTLFDLQEPTPTIVDVPSVSNEAKLTKRIEALEKAIEEANHEKRLREKKDAEVKEKNVNESALLELKKDDWVDLSNEKWSTKLGGQIFFDYVNWANASQSIQNNAKDVVSWRRIRLNYDATGYGVYDFRVQFDLDAKADSANSISTPFVAMKDVYLGINQLPLNGRIRAGNFFVPFSLDQVTPLPNIQFMERSIPSAGIFSPDRELGLASYHISDDLNKTLSLGLFFDEIPESTKQVVDDNQGLRLSTRATWLPYYDEPSDGRFLVHTGMGFVYTEDRDDTIRFRARPGEIRETQTLIDTGNLAAESYSVTNLELATVAGACSLQSEWFATSVNQTAANDVMLYGGYLQASYFLTGECRKYDRNGPHLAHFGRVRPFTNFFWTPGGTGWGAWEAKARWSYLDFGELNRGKYNDLTLGMNWYLHENSRVMLEWIHPWTTEDATVGNLQIGSTQSDLIAMRAQFTF